MSDTPLNDNKSESLGDTPHGAEAAIAKEAQKPASKGLAGVKTLKDFDFSGKRVFLRLDLNVPLEKGRITDDRRIVESLATIEYIRAHGGKLILCSHLGRPKGGFDAKYSLEPVAQHLTELLKAEVILIEDPRSDSLSHLLPTLKQNQILLLENIRFDAGETEDSIELAQHLAQFVDIYINDAFGSSHRAHASIHALPSLLQQKGVGLLIEKELSMLDQLIENPKRPYWAILGGSKVSDKIDVIEKLIDLVDGFMVGGAMAYTFLKAQGQPVGKSLVEADKIKYAKQLMDRIEARHKSFLLPTDHVIAEGLNDGQPQISTAIPEGKMGVDIGPDTRSRFATAIQEAATVFWNGPMGVFEKPQFAAGSFAVAKALSESKGVRIVGGGDSAAAAEASGYASKMTHISTGGGASLEYLQGARLPGIEILRYKVRPTAI